MIFGAKEKTLNKLRFSKFCHKVATSTVAVTPESLCPTSDAAGLHSLRVYHQVQAWMGNDIPALNWGWYMRKDNHLMRVVMSLPPAPQSLYLHLHYRLSRTMYMLQISVKVHMYVFQLQRGFMPKLRTCSRSC